MNKEQSQIKNSSAVDLVKDAIRSLNLQSIEFVLGAEDHFSLEGAEQSFSLEGDQVNKTKINIELSSQKNTYSMPAWVVTKDEKLEIFGYNLEQTLITGVDRPRGYERNEEWQPEGLVDVYKCFFDTCELFLNVNTPNNLDNHVDLNHSYADMVLKFYSGAGSFGDIKDFDLDIDIHERLFSKEEIAAHKFKDKFCRFHDNPEAFLKVFSDFGETDSVAFLAKSSDDEYITQEFSWAFLKERGLSSAIRAYHIAQVLDFLASSSPQKEDIKEKINRLKELLVEKVKAIDPVKYPPISKKAFRDNQRRGVRKGKGALASFNAKKDELFYQTVPFLRLFFGFKAANVLRIKRHYMRSIFSYFFAAHYIEWSSRQLSAESSKYEPYFQSYVNGHSNPFFLLQWVLWIATLIVYIVATEYLAVIVVPVLLSGLFFIGEYPASFLARLFYVCRDAFTYRFKQMAVPLGYAAIVAAQLVLLPITLLKSAYFYCRGYSKHLDLASAIIESMVLLALAVLLVLNSPLMVNILLVWLLLAPVVTIVFESVRFSALSAYRWIKSGNKNPEEEVKFKFFHHTLSPSKIQEYDREKAYKPPNIQLMGVLSDKEIPFSGR